MKLDYNIIWIDDKSDTRPFESMVSNVRKHLEEQFFNCNIQLFEDFDEFQDSFSDVIQYDLIITDLSLSNETTGKQVIDFVRENKHNHTEIFFYSANQTLKETNLLNFNRITFFQLSTENYRELENEITELIDLTIQKFQHIAAMRGMIMHETSSLDLKMDNIVKSFISNPANKEQTEQILVPIFDKIEINAKEKYDRAKSRKPDKILKDNVLFSASQKIFALGEVLKKLEIADFSGDYNNEIIWYSIMYPKFRTTFQ